MKTINDITISNVNDLYENDINEINKYIEEIQRQQSINNNYSSNHDSLEVHYTSAPGIDKLVKKVITIEFILKKVCEYFGLNPDIVLTNTRKREIVMARQVAMYFSDEMLRFKYNINSLSLEYIGAKIGGKDHATVLHAIKTVNNLCDTDKKFKKQVEEIGKILKG